MWPHIAFFVLDGIALWIALIVAASLILAAVEYDHPIWCTVLIILTLALLEYYTDWHPITYAIQYPILAITLVAAYFAIGTAWIIAKWYSHVYLVGDKFNRIKTEVRNELKRTEPAAFNQDGTLTDGGMLLFYDRAARKIGERKLPLQVGEHKAELYMWWAVWPLSMIWTIINDPIKRLWHFVYNQISGLLQGISDRAFKVDR